MVAMGVIELDKSEQFRKIYFPILGIVIARMRTAVLLFEVFPRDIAVFSAVNRNSTMIASTVIELNNA